MNLRSALSGRPFHQRSRSARVSRRGRGLRTRSPWPCLTQIKSISRPVTRLRRSRRHRIETSGRNSEQCLRCFLNGYPGCSVVRLKPSANRSASAEPSGGGQNCSPPNSALATAFSGGSGIASRPVRVEPVREAFAQSRTGVRTPSAASFATGLRNGTSAPFG